MVWFHARKEIMEKENYKEVFTRVRRRGDESMFIKLDRCLEDSPANWSIVIKVAAVITAISIITMIVKWI